MKKKVLPYVMATSMVLTAIPSPALAQEDTQSNSVAKANDADGAQTEHTIAENGLAAALGEKAVVIGDLTTTAAEETVILAPEDKEKDDADIAPDPISNDIQNEPMEIADECVISIPDELPSNDELFEAYAMNQFYGDNGIALYGSMLGDRLTGLEKTIYDELKGKLKQIADGDVTSTKFSLDTDLSSYSWTAADLGLTDLFDSEGSISSETFQAVKAKFYEPIINKIIQYLMSECPYEFYWLDKTPTAKSNAPFTLARNSSGDRVYIAEQRFEIAVALEYRGDDNYTVDSAKTTTVPTAVANAKKIVADNQDKTDQDKLTAYKDAICSMVSYDQEAYEAAQAGTNEKSGHWGIINVFDGDDDTKAVCSGYAAAFQYLCDLSTFTNGTVCYKVAGTMDGGDHEWNLVKLNGGVLMVDVTNTSPNSNRDLFLKSVENNGKTYTISGLKYVYSQSTLDRYSAEELTLRASQEKTLSSIAITTPPTKTEYIAGENFDPEGMVVIAKYSDGTEVDVTDKVAVAPETLAAGTTFVTISYTPDDAAAQSFTAKQEVSVFDELPTEKTLVGIAVTKAPTKTEYTVGENFVADGMEVTATYVEDGETKTEVLADDAYTVTGGDDLQLGTTSVTISYTEGVDTAAVTKTATQSITVKAEATLVDIAIKTPPTKTAYTAGENFSTAGMVVMARYSDGTEVDVSKDIEVVGGTGLQVGTTSVTIKYGEKTATQLITVTKDSGTTPVTPGGNTGGGSSGGSGGGGGKSSTTTPTTPATDEKSETTTVTNPDGSTTTTVTNPDGSSVETTTYPDGSKTVTETDENGNQTITETRPDGTEIRTEISRRGEVKSDIKLPEGADEVTVKIPTENRPTAGTVAAIVNPDGTREILLDAIIDRDGVTVTLDKDATIEIFDNAKSFTDVPSSSWAKESIDFVTARELFAGVSDTEFGHNSPMTRAMLMTVLARLDGQDTSGGATWYEKGMAWAVAKGISDGTNPNGTITREQLAAMMYRYAGSPATSGSLDIFLDSGRVSPYAVDALRWAVEQGIISGMGDGTLDPQGNATRAQVAAMLMRFMNATK